MYYYIYVIDKCSRCCDIETPITDLIMNQFMNQFMNQYTLYCTEDQTRKAFELGAPIRYKDTLDNRERGKFETPTAEQMLGWLEEQNIAIDLHAYFKVNNSRINHYEYTVTDSTRVFNGNKITREEATIAAIDKALNYLIEKKGE